MSPRPPAARPWWIVTAREISVKLHDRSFLLSTVVTVLLVAGSIAGSALLGGRAADHVLATAAPEAGPVAARAAQALADSGDDTLTVHSAHSRDAARRAVADESSDAALLRGLDGWTVVGKDDVDPGLARALEQAVAEETLAANARAAGTTAEELTAGAEVRTELLSGRQDRGPVRLVMGFVFAFLFYLAAILFGMAIANSVLEEKQNRVVEILATAVPVRQLLYGKVLGSCLLAFGQLGLYAAVGLVGVNVTGAAADVGWVLAASGWFVAFFVAGFAAQACVWAVLGSLASRSEDLQTSSGPILTVLVGALLVGLYAEGAWLTAASFVPVVSSVAMPVRMLAGGVAWWQPVLSLALALAAAWVLLRLGERIYRRAVFQGGRSLTWREASRLEQ
ncbi:multidrug ABC transporter permease [Kocuria rosea subsp. polaris]|uniref:Multidrug ABC transporter permease n=1 Tax=Kocuria rosea subsp. polaris TaxID=136273 RepID=A0A0W8I7I0_KOCRO|nr:ABC transporter permease [Kocuria polaris]KUG55352.1 multidrug ABC transporter permease [Kocuria polaris]